MSLKIYSINFTARWLSPQYRLLRKDTHTKNPRSPCRRLPGVPSVLAVVLIGVSSGHKPLHFYHFLGSFNLCKLKNNNNQRRYTPWFSRVSTRPCPDYHSLGHQQPLPHLSGSSGCSGLQLSPVAEKAPQPCTMIYKHIPTTILGLVSVLLRSRLAHTPRNSQ